MPWVKCKHCHHEYSVRRDNMNANTHCDWCGGQGHIVLEESTPLEQMFERMLKGCRYPHKTKEK